MKKAQVAIVMGSDSDLEVMSEAAKILNTTEFKPFFNHSLKSRTVHYLLTHYTTPSRMARMNVDSFNKMRTQLRGRFSYARFIQLKEL